MKNISPLDVVIDTSLQQTTLNPIPTIVETPDKQDLSKTNLKIGIDIINIS